MPSITDMLNTLSAGPTSNADSLHTHATLSKKLFTITSVGNAIAGTTTETSMLTGATVVGTRTIPANSLVAGNLIRISAYFSAINTGGPAGGVVRLKSGSTIISDTGTIPSNPVLQWEIFCRSIGASGSFYNPTGATGPSTFTVDTTVDLTLDLTFQWNLLPGTQSVTLQAVIVEML